MAIQLLPLLATGGALVGGIQGFRRSGGNLGSAALGAGTGALTASGAGALGRFAGAKLLGAALPGGLTGAGGQALLKAAAAGNPTAAAALKIPALAGLGVGGTTVATGKLGVGNASPLNEPQKIPQTTERTPQILLLSYIELTNQFLMIKSSCSYT